MTGAVVATFSNRFFLHFDHYLKRCAYSNNRLGVWHPNQKPKRKIGKLCAEEQQRWPSDDKNFTWLLFFRHFVGTSRNRIERGDKESWNRKQCPKKENKRRRDFGSTWIVASNLFCDRTVIQKRRTLTRAHCVQWTFTSAALLLPLLLFLFVHLSLSQLFIDINNIVW